MQVTVGQHLVHVGKIIFVSIRFVIFPCPIKVIIQQEKSHTIDLLSIQIDKYEILTGLVFPRSLYIGNLAIWKRGGGAKREKHVRM